jgi:hypothetical protein
VKTPAKNGADLFGDDIFGAPAPVQNNGNQQNKVTAPQKARPDDDIFSMDLFGGAPAQPVGSPPAKSLTQSDPKPQTGGMDLFGGDLMGGNSNPAPAQPKKYSNDQDDFEFDDFAEDTPERAPARKNVLNFLAFTTDHIDITFESEKVIFLSSKKYKGRKG